MQREDPRFIVYAAIGIGISAFFALRSSEAEDAFLPGMLQNAGLLVLLLVTNLVRWPLFGFVVGVAEPEAFAEDPTWWRRHRGIVTVAMQLAWVLIALNVVRLAIMVPLYLAEQVAALGVAKVVLGWPAYLLAIRGGRSSCAVTPRSTRPAPPEPHRLAAPPDPARRRGLIGDQVAAVEPRRPRPSDGAGCPARRDPQAGPPAPS